MEKEKNQKAKKTCFVVMGFGKKTDFETGRILDLDKSYRNMIKPAVEAAGLKCIRADEIVHSGLIDVPMYEQLLNADVVVADLSTSNKNAFYELGIRHALRPFTTVVIAEDGIKQFPFDINHVAVRQYHHLGEDIGFDEVMRFRKQLTKAIKEIMNKDPRDKDSPVYTFLHGLNPPALAAAVQASIQEGIETNVQIQKLAEVKKTVAGTNEGASVGSGLPEVSETHSELMRQVDDMQKSGDWKEAKRMLTSMRQLKLDEMKKHGAGKKTGMQQTEDPYILQRLALATYKSKSPNEKEALLEARQLLNLLNPVTSNDPETLGLWGAVHKRLWELTKDMNCLDEAVRAYERGFYIKNDYYNGINYAFLLNVRAAASSEPAEAIADFVEARRVRKEVLSICEQWLKDNGMPDQGKATQKTIDQYLKNQYWVKATIGEAYIGIGDETEGLRELEEAFASPVDDWMRQSTKEQIEKLRPLLNNSPLKFIRA
jgi:tetratricopeptide (TPR) repeat protein